MYMSSSFKEEKKPQGAAFHFCLQMGEVQILVVILIEKTYWTMKYLGIFTNDNLKKEDLFIAGQLLNCCGETLRAKMHTKGEIPPIFV